MDNNLNELIAEISERLTVVCYGSIVEKLGDEYEVSPLINLILSSHITSLFRCMKAASSNNENATKNVDEFIESLKTSLLSQPIIKEIEEFKAV